MSKNVEVTDVEVVKETETFMPDVLVNWLLEPSEGSFWVYQVFVLVFLTMIATFITKKALARLNTKLAGTKNIWDDALLSALQKPLIGLIWLVGLSYCIEFAQKVAPSDIFGLIDPIRKLGVIAMLAWFLIRLIKNIETSYVAREEAAGDLDHTTIYAISKLLRASVLITSVLVVLQSLGYSISGVLAFGGIGGIAVGFAAKDLLANFFGGLMIYLDRPFSVGDWVRSPDRDIEGTVTDIGWRLTLITTFDKRPLYVPNSTFTNISVENPSRMTNRRIYETIGVRYDDASKMDQIVDKVKEMLEKHPEIASDQTLIVNFNAFAPSSLDFFVYAFTKTTNWVRFHEIKQEVLLKIFNIIDELGAEIAFPTSTLHLHPEGTLRHQPLPAGKQSD